MAGRLIREIKQTKAFPSIEAEAMLNIVMTSELLGQKLSDFFKDFGLTGTQYNVLRILRGAGEPGLTCSQLSERMITKDPDITRLLDRMEARNLVRRERSTTDRRVVVTKITQEALDLLTEIDEPSNKMISGSLGKLSPEKLNTLIDLLEQVRATFD